MAENLNLKYEKRAKKFLIITLITIPLIGYLSIRTVLKEDICTKKAQQIVGKNWTKEVKVVTSEEIKQAPFLAEEGKIILGFKELLKCEREFRYLLP